MYIITDINKPSNYKVNDTSIPILHIIPLNRLLNEFNASKKTNMERERKTRVQKKEKYFWIYWKYVSIHIFSKY